MSGVRYLAMLVACAASAVQSGVDGSWEVPIPGRPAGVIIELKTEGPRLTGTFAAPNGRLNITNGAVSGREVQFDMVTNMGSRSLRIHYTGRVVGDELTLTGVVPGIEQKMIAKRRPPNAPPPDWFSAPEAPKEVTAWLGANAIPLDNLAALESRLTDARIVAMGEATHGTREFQQLKARMFRFLVERLGYTVFAIESPWSTSQNIDDYVQGRTDELSFEGHTLWWRTAEVADLARWMRAYNQDPTHMRKVKFTGFDVRGVEILKGRVLGYLGRVDPQHRGAAARMLAELSEPEAPSYQNAGDAVHRRVAEGLAALVRRFDAAKQEYIGRSSEREWAVARQSAVVLQQSERKGRLSETMGMEPRDESMAENVKWLLDQEPAGTKMMLWAHNGHVSADPEPYANMGSRLRRIYGDAMVVFGFVFGEGSFRANDNGVRTFTVGPPPRGSLDATLGTVGMPLFAVDLRTAKGAVGDWFAAPHISRQIGGGYSEATAPIYFQQTRARTAFDILIYVGKTTGSKPL
jgi:erythromycin esterase